MVQIISFDRLTHLYIPYALAVPSHKPTMKNPNDFQFPPNQTQHNPAGPINASHKASTLPKTEVTMRPIIGAQSQLPRRKPRNSVARGAIVKAKALALDLNVPPFKCFLCGKTYDKKMALCGHMKKHPNRSWKGALQPPSTFEWFDDLNN